MTAQTQDALRIRPATTADAEGFADAHTDPNGSRAAALRAAVQCSPAPALIEDHAGRPVALVGCIPMKDSNGAPWIELTGAAGAVKEVLVAHLKEWTRAVLLPRHAVLFGTVPAEDELRRDILGAVGFTFMEPIEGAGNAPACIPCFLRAA